MSFGADHRSDITPTPGPAMSAVIDGADGGDAAAGFAETRVAPAMNRTHAATRGAATRTHARRGTQRPAMRAPSGTRPTPGAACEWQVMPGRAGLPAVEGLPGRGSAQRC